MLKVSTENNSQNGFSVYVMCKISVLILYVQILSARYVQISVYFMCKISVYFMCKISVHFMCKFSVYFMYKISVYVMCKISVYFMCKFSVYFMGKFSVYFMDKFSVYFMCKISVYFMCKISVHFMCKFSVYFRPVYTTSVLGTAPLKMGTVPKLPLRYLLVYTTTFCRHTFMIGTVPIGKRHLYFPFTTVYFRINMSDRNRIIYLYLLERRRVLYEPKIEGKTQLNTRKLL